jgi:hypothetical protein
MLQHGVWVAPVNDVAVACFIAVDAIDAIATLVVANASTSS